MEDMQYEMRRHMLHIDEMNNINMMRDGLRMMCTEHRDRSTDAFAILELNGWASEVCSDMNRYDSALGKLYRQVLAQLVQHDARDGDRVTGWSCRWACTTSSAEVLGRACTRACRLPPPPRAAARTAAPKRRSKRQPITDVSDTDSEDLPP